MRLDLVSRLLPLALAAAVLVIARANGGYDLATRSAVGIELWFGLALAAATGLAARRAPRGAWTVLGGLALFSAATLASAWWASSADAAFDEFTRVVLLIGVVAATALLPSPRNVVRWTNGLAWGITAVAVLSLASRLLPQVVHGDRPLSFLGGSQTRLYYPVGYWTALGVLMALGFPLLLRMATAASVSPLRRGVALAPVPVLGAVLFLTSARLGVIVVGLGWLVFLVSATRRAAIVGATATAAAGVLAAVGVILSRRELGDGPFGTSKAHADGLIAAILIALIVVLTGLAYSAAVAVLPAVRPMSRRTARSLVALLVACVAAVVVLSHPIRRFDAIRSVPPNLTQASVQQHFLSGSSNGRWQLWRAALDEFRRYPIAGHGAGSYQEWWAQHGSLSFFARDAHSLFLEQFGELGLIGGPTLLAVFVLGLALAARRVRAARANEREVVASLLAVFVAFTGSAAVDWMWESTIVSIVGLASLGLAIGRGGAPSEPATGARPPRAVAAALVVVALAATGVEGLARLEHSALGASRQAFIRRDYTSAARAATDARALEPWAASPYLQLALVYEAAGAQARAERAVTAAITRDRQNWQLWVVAARIQTERGEIGLAGRSLRAAIHLNPRSTFLRGLENGR